MKAVVLGDLMTDVWTDYVSVRPNPEDRFTQVVRLASETVMPGGAGNVAANLRATGHDVVLLDTAPGVRPAMTVKQRVTLDGRLLFRFDRDVPVLPDATVDLIQRIRAELPDWIVAVDYAKGALTAPLLTALLGSFRACRWFLDLKPALRREVRGLSARCVVKSNGEEAAAAPLEHPDALIVTTHGAGGASWVQGSDRGEIIPKPVTVRSVCGAGDVCAALLIDGLSQAMEPREAIERAVGQTTLLCATGERTLRLVGQCVTC